MGKLWNAVAGVSTKAADELVRLEGKHERGEATAADSARLERLDRAIPDHVQHQIRSERGGR